MVVSTKYIFPNMELRIVKNILLVGITFAKKAEIFVAMATKAKAQAKTKATSVTVK